MTKIGVISDTHGYMDDKIVGYFRDCDQIWHAGDIGDAGVLEKLEAISEVKAVYGNIDNHNLRIQVPEFQDFNIESNRIMIIHIAGYPGKYNNRVRKMIEERKPDFVVCGHSHILKIIYDKKLQHLHINPGAAGNSGFHKVRTLVRFNLDGKKAGDMEIIEMNK